MYIDINTFSHKCIYTCAYVYNYTWKFAKSCAYRQFLRDPNITISSHSKKEKDLMYTSIVTATWAETCSSFLGIFFGKSWGDGFRLRWKLGYHIDTDQ